MIHQHLDPYAILQVLDVHDAVNVTPVQGGTDTAIWRVERAGQIFALRVFQRGQFDDCRLEQEVMQAAQVAGLPVPQVHASGNWQEHPALLLSWLPGRPVFEELRARPWRARRLGTLFGRMHAAIHELPAPDVLRQQSEAWIRWSGSGEQALQKRLRSTNYQADALLHLDYHPLNVLTDGKRITAVLDWRNALAGDPRADAARTVSILRLAGFGRLRLLEVVVRRAFESGWRAGYAQKRRSLGDLSLFYAWAGAVMERDMASKCTPEELARIRRWTMRWKTRVGCA